jgi:two-component system chemotaxis response regulator CheY
LKNDQSFQISSTENDQIIFLKHSNINFIKSKILLNVLSKHLPKSKYKIESDSLVFELAKNAMDVVKKEKMSVDDESKEILSISHESVVSAKEYLQSTPLHVLPKIEELESTEDSLDIAILNFEKSCSKDDLQEICEMIDRYCDSLQLLVDFDHIVYALKSLIQFLQNIDEQNLVEDKVKSLTTMLYNLLEDLSSWRDNVFVKEEALDIHYLDSSLLSSCMQLESIFDEKEMDDGDDLEFF